MNDQDLDTLVASVAPVTDTQLAISTIAAPLLELCGAIMSTTPVHDPSGHDIDVVDPPPKPPERGRSAPRRWQRIAILATSAAAVAVAAVVVNVRGSDDANQAWAAPLVEFAERSPLLLLDDPEWSVTRADEYGDEGEMTFTNGERAADLHWRNPPLSHWLDDRLHGNADLGPHPTPGGTATVVRYEGSEEYTALWETGGSVIEFRTIAPTEGGFYELLDQLVVVTVDEWLSAMPDSVIQRASQPQAVADMLEGIPVPDGFDAAAIPNENSVTDRYQLGAQVAGAVSCAWFDQWFAAQASGDEIAAQSAEDALSTTSEWPILIEMDEAGDYGNVLAEYATEMRAGTGAFAGDEQRAREALNDGIGCGID